MEQTDETIVTDDTTMADAARSAVISSSPVPMRVLLFGIGGLLLLLALAILFFVAKSGDTEPLVSYIATSTTPNITVSPITDTVFTQGFASTGEVWTDPREAFVNNITNSPPLCQLRQQYCTRVGYKPSTCQCYIYQYFNSYRTFTNQAASLTVYYPPVWTPTTPGPSSVVSKPELLLQRNRTTCSIQYGSINATQLLAQSGATTTQLTPEQSISSLFAYQGDTPYISVRFTGVVSPEARAAGYTEFVTLAVPHFPDETSPYGFLLTSSESQPLLEACIEEFAETLNSRVVSYPEGQVTNQSAGQLVLQTKASSFAAAARIPYRPQIVFTDERTGHKSAIASDGLTELSWYAEPLIAGHTLYYQSGYASTTRLEAVDLFAGTHRTLPVVYDPTTPIHSFYVTGDQLYYLTGEFCNEYMARCHDMNLHQYDLVTEVHAVLATTSASRRVMGLDGSGNIVLAMQEGDAGCGWGTFESYNTKTKTLDSVGSYNGCEAELEPAYAPYKNLTVGMTQTYAVQVTNGQLLPAVVDKPAREWTSIRVVTQ